MGYPLAAGLPELRAAIAAWVATPLRRGARPGAADRPDARLEGGGVPPGAGRRHDRRPRSRARDRARLSGAGAGRALRRRPRRGAAAPRGRRLPPRPRRRPGGDLARVRRSSGRTTRTTRRARRRRSRSTSGSPSSRGAHDFVFASDEAYSELYFGEPPVSALELADRRNVVAVNTLSKRSSMTGYRSGFVAGDPELVAALKAYRPNVGTAPQEFVQRASVAAWGDEEHVERTRERYRAQARGARSPRSSEAGCASPAATRRSSSGSRAPSGESSETFAAHLLEDGIVVAPGSFFGADGEGYVRMALVPTLEDCERAAELLVRRFGAMSSTPSTSASRRSPARDDYVKPAAWALGVATRAADGDDARRLVPARQLRESLPLRRDDLGGGRRAGAARPSARVDADAVAVAQPSLRAARGRRRQRAHPNRDALRVRWRRSPTAWRSSGAAGASSSPCSSPTWPRAPASVEDAYLRLHLLSHRAVQPHGLSLDGIFGILPNVVWTDDGPYPVDGFERARADALAAGVDAARPLGGQVPADDRLRRPSGVRIGDADRVRLGAHLAEGTTVMHEGFVNYNAGHARPLDGRGPDQRRRRRRRGQRRRRWRLDPGHALGRRQGDCLASAATASSARTPASASRSATAARSRPASTSPPGRRWLLEDGRVVKAAGALRAGRSPLLAQQPDGRDRGAYAAQRGRAQQRAARELTSTPRGPDARRPRRQSGPGGSSTTNDGQPGKRWFCQFERRPVRPADRAGSACPRRARRRGASGMLGPQARTSACGWWNQTVSCRMDPQDQVAGDAGLRLRERTRAGVLEAARRRLANRRRSCG